MLIFFTDIFSTCSRDSCATGSQLRSSSSFPPLMTRRPSVERWWWHRPQRLVKFVVPVSSFVEEHHEEISSNWFAYMNQTFISNILGSGSAWVRIEYSPSGSSSRMRVRIQAVNEYYIFKSVSQVPRSCFDQWSGSGSVRIRIIYPDPFWVF